MAKRAFFFVAASMAFFSSHAYALNQPNGPQIPQTGQLQSLFDADMDPINALNDAADVPETFNPTCNLDFHLVSRGQATFQDAFGWYNVTGQIPPLSDLHVLLDCNTQPPASVPLAIKNDPNYKGGLVGFFIMTPEGLGNLCASPQNHTYVYYSEKAYNPDNTGPNSYIHLLIYDSKKYKKSFYFAWEDLYSGGDNNFTDIVTRVDGITCANGGGACQTGKPGICADGTLQCQNGVLTCVQTNQPAMEKCDAIDDDCNGQVDEGDICQPGYVCDKGSCVPQCGGEIQCAGALVCDPNGLCVDPKCSMVTCPEGQKCVGGQCLAPCDNVVCPHGQVCSFGACIDPCAAITCDADQVCVAGACLAKCDCTGCAANEACQMDGRCLANVCVGKNCAVGTYCDMTGNCVDSCMGATCPAGEVCMQGSCSPAPMTTGSGGASGTASFVGSGGATSGSLASGSSGSGIGGFGGNNDTPRPSGCGCRVGERDEGGSTAALLALGAIGLARSIRKGKKSRKDPS